MCKGMIGSSSCGLGCLDLPWKRVDINIFILKWKREKLNIKLWFRTMFYVKFYCIPVQSFLCIFVRFNVRVEYESWWRIVKIEKFVIGSRVDNSQKATWEAHAGIWIIFCQTIFRKWLRDLANLQVTHKTLCLELFKKVFFSFLYLHYKSLRYPRNCKEIFREKTLAKHLRVRDCKCKVVIYNYVFCWLLVRAKFDCNFIQSFYTMYLLWDLTVKIVW